LKGKRQEPLLVIFLLAIFVQLLHPSAAAITATITVDLSPPQISTLSHDQPSITAVPQQVWTVLFKQPGRYHWMFQYYLRQEGLALSWVGTGRCLFSLDFTPAQYEQTKAALLAAGAKMKAHGWWWDGSGDGEVPLTGGAISARMGKELASALVGLR